jgi:hypothetical protein
MYNTIINITPRVVPDTDRLNDLDTRLKQLEIENRQLKEKQKVEIEGLDNKLINAQDNKLNAAQDIKIEDQKNEIGDLKEKVEAGNYK